MGPPYEKIVIFWPPSWIFGVIKYIYEIVLHGFRKNIPDSVENVVSMTIVSESWTKIGQNGQNLDFCPPSWIFEVNKYRYELVLRGI